MLAICKQILLICTHLALMRAILERCMRDWEGIDRIPMFRLLKEPITLRTLT
jgi:hypothetical protein